MKNFKENCIELLYRFKYYYVMKNWYMCCYIIWLYLKLFLKVKCKCPEGIQGHKVEVIYWPRTAYHWDHKGRDPNGPILCCEAFAIESTAYWDDRWADYYSGLL